MATINEEDKLKGKVEEEEEEEEEDEEDMENKNSPSSSSATKPFQFNPSAEPWSPQVDRADESQLNPSAQPWNLNAHDEATPEENRSLFMTFSRGFPLTRDQIIMYFTRKYGNCLEEVFLHAPHGREPEFGKVVFTTPSVPATILKNQDVVKVVFGGRSMWLKKYQRRD